MRSDSSFEEKAEQALSIGKRYLGVENGHVTRIDRESNYWKAIASSDGSTGEFPVGLQLDLRETYCRRTLQADSSVALHDAPQQGWDDDPAFETHGLHCYHGTPIVLDDEPYGTVCFVSTEPRDDPFSDAETMFAELVARMVEHQLQRERTAAKVNQLDRFAGVVSHDLRNPLNVAQGHVDLERERRESDQLAIAANALDRMENLISDVLAMARQGHDVEETDVVSLESIVETCWQSVRTDGATVTVTDDLQFKANGERSKQLFENLFRNAVEHGSTTPRSHAHEDAVEHGSTSPRSHARGDAVEDGGTNVDVRVGPLADGDGFFIEDDGPGIPASERDHIFATGYSTGREGVGLGLSIVTGVATAHDWTVSVEESSAGGARFEISSVVVPSTDSAVTL